MRLEKKKAYFSSENEKKLIEFIKRTSEDLCLICRNVNIERCREEDYNCETCTAECLCRDCPDGKNFELDEEALDQWYAKKSL